jgi:4-hydroxy-4-methyl-2-oxoglutarate aldolase
MLPAANEAAVERLRRLDCCSVSDALDRLGIEGVASGLPRRSGTGRIAGRAITLKVGVGAPPADKVRHLGTHAVELGGPQHVIVIEQRSGLEAGCWGGLLTLGARIRGITGVIADGPVRDIDEAIDYAFPIFSSSVTARTARQRVVELGTNVPIEIRGIRVNEGDFLVADSSAVVVIPAAHIDSVLQAAEAIAAREAAMAQALRAFEPISSVMAGNYENMLRDPS